MKDAIITLGTFSSKIGNELHVSKSMICQLVDEIFRLIFIFRFVFFIAQMYAIFVIIVFRSDN